MFAIVTIAGQQFKVSEGQELLVNSLGADEGQSLSFDDVLLVSNDNNVSIGNPVLASASVKATVVGEERGDKVIVFKKKRRKGYKVKNGHRQPYTKIKIDAINA
jgi:large subunit ribosomal protein L21